MEDIIGDLTNVYLACIDSYTPRWRQTIDDIDGISNKSFFKNLLIQHYIYLKEGILDANATIRSRYFTEDEIKKVRDEIKMLRENPESFWN